MATKKVNTAIGDNLPLVWNSLNAKFKPKQKDKPYPPSQTIPDQSMSMREILLNHTSGVLNAKMKLPIYDELEESLGIDPRGLDLVDIQKYQLENNEKIDRLKEEIESKRRIKVGLEKAEDEKRKADEAFKLGASSTTIGVSK